MGSRQLLIRSGGQKHPSTLQNSVALAMFLPNNDSDIGYMWQTSGAMKPVRTQ